jgi:hypothetical protein
MVNISVHVLDRMGHFPKEYKTGILRGNGTSKTNDFASFKFFWENTIQIAAFTNIPANQHGYGMAATNNGASAFLLMHVVLNVGTAYAATQESCQSNASNITTIQGQLQMLCQVVGTSKPPQQQQQSPHNGCGYGQKDGGNNGGGNGGGNGSSKSYNNGGGGDSYNNGSGGYSSGGSGGNANGSGVATAATTATVVATGEIRTQAAPCQ